MMPLTAMRLMASAEGQRLISTIRRHVSSENRPPEQVLQELLDHLDKVEEIAKRTGKTVKQIEDEAISLYEEKYR
jgi:hypothetical protein